MSIPDFQSIMLPLLKVAVKGESSIRDSGEVLAREFGLSDLEVQEMLPSRADFTFRNRVRWAKTYLGKAGLIEPTKRGHFRLTDRGQKVLNGSPSKIDISFLMQFDEFRDFRRTGRDEGNGGAIGSASNVVQATTQTPDELIQSLHGEIESALRKELIARILSSSPSFFEKVIVSLLLAMGYGGARGDAGRAIGKAGDGGLDGVIDEDTLGLDRVYIQAKRYRYDNSVGEPDVRGFAGSLQGVKANKGVFVTTSYFTEPAISFAEKVPGRIVLIDGEELADLMVKYNVGARVETTLYLKKVDEDFFSED